MSMSASPQLAIDRKYRLVRELGQGAYGIVCAARNVDTGDNVAIKKVTKIFDKTILAKRALREIKLLRFFNGHDNIINMVDMEIVDPERFNEMYLVQELMEADLHQIIRSGQALTDAHFQYFLYQILRGLNFIHSANVLHRDLKPGNVLVNADCELKICDFGLARGFDDSPEANAGFMTEYVATRWYRAPEIMLSFASYTKASKLTGLPGLSFLRSLVDLWSVGCIFAEMLGGKPLFKGRDYVDQLNQILAIRGSPDDSTVRRVGSDRAQVYIRSLPRMQRVPLSQLYPKASALALDLLDRLLDFDPASRITVEQALAHPYLATYHDEEDEYKSGRHFDFTFERAQTIEEIRRLIAAEVADFKREQDTVNEVAEQQPVVTPISAISPATQNAVRPPREQLGSPTAHLAGRSGLVSSDGDKDVDMGIAAAVAPVVGEDTELERALGGGMPMEL